MKEALAGTATILVIGASAGAREATIAALLRSNATTASDSIVPSVGDQLPSVISRSGTAPSAGLDAVILEGFGVAADPLASGPGLQVTRIAPGCLCCDGNLVLRVTLNRLLRQRPGRLFIGLASSEHLDQLRSWLQSAPYDQLLALGPVVSAETA